MAKKTTKKRGAAKFSGVPKGMKLVKAKPSDGPTAVPDAVAAAPKGAKSAKKAGAMDSGAKKKSGAANKLGFFELVPTKGGADSGLKGKVAIADSKGRVLGMQG